MTALQPADPRTIGEYQVLGRLGAGSQGVVYLAATPAGDRVAIKQLILGVENERNRRQFAKEVDAARLVAPFCTAQLLDVQLDGPAPYVVSEYIDGPSLQQKIVLDGPLIGVELQRMAIGTATALVAIHQVGVVHRDFKPANVMLSPDGPRVIDFGIARNLSTETTITARVFGTPAYMSPEQLENEPVNAAADMFAWASVITYAATGHPPFEADHMMAIAYRITKGEPTLTGVPAGLMPLLESCLAKDPGRRPTAEQALQVLLGRGEADAVPADLAPLLARGSRIAESDAPLPPAPGPHRSRPEAGSRRTVGLRRAVVAGVLICALAVAGWGAIRSGRLSGGTPQAGSGPTAEAPGPSEDSGRPDIGDSASGSPGRLEPVAGGTPSARPTKVRKRTATDPPDPQPSTRKADSKPSAPAVTGTGPIIGLAGKCLDIQNAWSADGTVVQLVACNQTKAQIWTASRNGTIKALGRCLNVAAGRVNITTCDGTGDQTWRVTADAVVNTGSGLCLGTLSGAATEYTPTVVNACTGARSQTWSLRA